MLDSYDYESHKIIQINHSLTFYIHVFNEAKSYIFVLNDYLIKPMFIARLFGSYGANAFNLGPKFFMDIC